jgi:hypothetical protein
MFESFYIFLWRSCYLFFLFAWIRSQKVVPSRRKTQKMITTFMKTSPAVVAPNTPVLPPSTSTAAPEQPPAGPQPSTDPTAGEQAPKEVIPISSGRKDESCSENFRDAAEKTKDKEEAEVISADKAEALVESLKTWIASLV